jgi:Domain of unknown function (DUF4266)
VAYQPSSDARARPSRATIARLIQLGLGLVLSACATVKPQDKELLADPAMVYGSGGAADAQEAHVLDNREGANEGGAKGGGCGCN